MPRLVVAGVATVFSSPAAAAKTPPGRTPAGFAQVRFLDDRCNENLDGAYATLHPA